MFEGSIEVLGRWEAFLVDNQALTRRIIDEQVDSADIDLFMKPYDRTWGSQIICRSLRHQCVMLKPSRLKTHVSQDIESDPWSTPPSREQNGQSHGGRSVEIMKRLGYGKPP